MEKNPEKVAFTPDPINDLVQRASEEYGAPNKNVYAVGFKLKKRPGKEPEPMIGFFVFGSNNPNDFPKPIPRYLPYEFGDFKPVDGNPGIKTRIVVVKKICPLTGSSGSGSTPPKAQAGEVIYGTPNNEMGTITAIIKRRETPGGALKPFILSAHHVLAGTTFRINDPVYQPGTSRLRMIGRLKWVTSTASTNGFFVDYALASINNNIARSAEIKSLGRVGAPIDNFLTGARVQKYGESTHLTQGTVDYVNIVFPFATSTSDEVKGFSINGISFASDGDSGAPVIVLNAQGNWHFAGSLTAIASSNPPFYLALYVKNIIDKIGAEMFT